MLPTVEPMLAAPASTLRRLPAGEWRLEPKLDGWRALVYVDDGQVIIRSRHGRDLTASLPELTVPAAGLAGHSVILDGELIAGAGTATDFYRLGPRLARGARTAHRGCRVSFVAFDVLHLDGLDLTPLPYRKRRKRLERLRLDEGCWRTADSLCADPAELLAACEDLGLEGLVAKRLDGSYLPGRRTTDWIKLKTPSWREEPRRAAPHEVAASLLEQASGRAVAGPGSTTGRGP